MNFDIYQSIEVLERTPQTLSSLLQNISGDWTLHNEGGDTWSVYDVMGHLIHGEQTDWMVRVELILSENSAKPFAPFDRYAQFENSKGKALSQLLNEFEILRASNLARLRQYDLGKDDLLKTGLHPTFGQVTLGQLLAAWVVHDLDHLAQIARVMAKQYKENVGPWIEFLQILRL